MNPPLRFVIAAMLLFAGSAQGKTQELSPYSMPRTQVLPIKDSERDRQYELYVRLPEDYSETAATLHPVIYTTDAVWHMEMLAAATEFLMPNAIVVGISWQTDLSGDRPHISRFRDYTTLPSTNEEHQAKYQRGQAQHHLSFIRNVVIPRVEGRYKIDPKTRTYFGYSLGGAFGAYVLLSEPDSFRHYILGSPAFGDRSLAYAEGLAPDPQAEASSVQVDAWVSIGERETAQLERIGRLIRLLESKKDAGINLVGLEVIKDADHAAGFPGSAISSIRWLHQRINE